MDLNWSLKELYKSFEDEKFQSDLKNIDNVINDLNELSTSAIEGKDDIKTLLEEYINKMKEFNVLVINLSNFISLSMSVNTKDTKASKYSDILDDKLSNAAPVEARFTKWIGEIKDLSSIINSSEILKEHEFLLKEKVETSHHTLSDDEETIISKMKNTGSTAWSKLCDNLTANLMVDINLDGKETQIPLSAARNLAYDENESVRKTAYEAELKSYKKIEDSIASCLNSIKGEVITTSAMRGYKSPLEEALVKSRMNEEILNAMISAMKKSLPVFRKYLKKKGELLGHKNGLPFYDLFAPIGSSNMKYTYEEAGKFVEANYKTFGEELGNFARTAIDNHWIDVMPKEGKVGGAFCASLHPQKQCRVLLNFGGTFSDVVTMAHELGHGFHDYCLNDESILNSDYPMPIAETASTFCETIVKKAAVKTASKEEALAILESEISDCTQVIVDILSRFLFEKSVFEKRKDGALSVDELKELMLDAQRQSYGDGLDPEYMHPYMWLCKSHYYSADYSFYNFPYAFGLLFAKGLYAEYMKKGPSFFEDYKHLLSVTGKNMLADVTKIINIDITKEEFWANSLKTVEEDIETFLKLV